VESARRATRILEYVRGLGRDPDRLERVAYSAIVAHVAARHSRDLFARECKALRAELERRRAKAAEQGRKDPTSHAMRDEVIAKMAAAIAADPL
jgi:hypothetical protein